MINKQKCKKAFTLIELLIVIAIIGVLATIVLISLDTARDKAKVASYVSYMTQASRLTADAIAGGYMDNYTDTTACCFGVYTTGCTTCTDLNARLNKLSEVPNPGMESPFNPTGRVTIQKNGNYMRVSAGVSTDDITTTKVCKEAGWAIDVDSCYIDHKITAR